MSEEPDSKNPEPAKPVSPNPQTEPANAEEEESPAAPQRDLSQRFMVQAAFPSLGRDARWESINSYPTLMTALRGSSECLQAVQIIFGQTPELSQSVNDVQIRILDREKESVVVYEDDTGNLHCVDEDLLAD